MRRSMQAVGALSFLVAASFAAFGGATEQTFFVSMTGDQEVPGPGDPEGSASGTVTLNELTGMVSWDIVYMNLQNVDSVEDIVGFHIHPGAFGESGGIHIGLGTTNMGLGTLVGSTVAPLDDVAAVLADPFGFYVNIHTNDFTPGAVRGQLPAPSGAALLLLGAGMAARRRR